MLKDSMQTTRSTGRRQRIWDLVDLQCPVIGTCLNLGELRKIARQAEVDFQQSVSEFDIHSYFVAQCKDPGRIARLVSKKLDRKFAGAIRRYQSCKTEEALRALWREDLERGDIPGPFWAVASHANITTRLRTEVFGEVHMLSHLVGSANRADIRRLALLEEEQERLTASMQRMKTVFRCRVQAFQAERDAMAQELNAARRELSAERSNRTSRTGQAGTDASLNVENSGTSANSVNAAVNEFELEALRRELEQTRRDRDGMARLLEAESRRLEFLESENREVASENQVLESEIARLLERGDDCSEAGGERCPCPDLCGMCVLYVGGRTGLVPQYRALVESRGGRLIHHDGGLEEAPKRLESALAQADAVVCPVDCVSHEACTVVKSFCKRSLKPCFMMRSAGISSLAKTVSSLPVHAADRSGNAATIHGPARC
jgi:hypothetical protein